MLPAALIQTPPLTRAYATRELNLADFFNEKNVTVTSATPSFWTASTPSTSPPTSPSPRERLTSTLFSLKPTTPS